MPADRARDLLPAGALLLLVTVTFSNHFANAFHFDDSHTVIDNPHIRSLANVPRFFTDAETFSTLPANRSYRPVVSASLAFDYWLGGGLDPFCFHLSTFLWYLLQLVLMWRLFLLLLDATRPHEANRYTALLAAALYGVHPAMAETVNYVIQRGDLYSTFGVVAGLWVYGEFPGLRRYCIYLIPFVLGALAKPPALVFPLLLALVVAILAPGRRRLAAALIPATATAAALAVVNARMTPASYTGGAADAAAYRLTQPLVALHYFSTFFLPVGLTADTDRVPVSAPAEALPGFLFVIAMAAVGVYCWRQPGLRVLAFGLAWFLIALVPTSLYPLAEVDNDHRMFFPFVGLAVAVVFAASLLLAGRIPAAWLAAATACLLAAAAAGTRQRNEVWRDEASLWRDVTQKSPRNGRGLMNYGLTRMAAGDVQEALGYFERALPFTPDYPILAINLGIAYGELHRDAEAEKQFLRAISLAPADAQTHLYYGRWLDSRGRLAEALEQLETARAQNRDLLEPRYSLMAIYQKTGDGNAARIIAQETLGIAPGDTTARAYLALPGKPPATPEDFLALSLHYHQAGRYQDSIDAARAALGLRAGYAEAWNNISAACASLERWDEAIEAARKALELKPDFERAGNNLEWAVEQKARKGQSR